MISVIELLTIIQLCGMQVLEMYCMEKCNELFYKRQVGSFCHFIEPVAELNQNVSFEDCPEEEVKSEPTIREEYEVSAIEGTGAEELFESLRLELVEESITSSEQSEESIGNDTEHPDMELASQLNAMDQLHNGVEVDQVDCLSMEDLQEEESFEMDKQYSSFATAKIKDEVLGEQQWTVSVVGVEQQYIHVSDGSRIWLNIGEQARHVHNGDVLALDVNRGNDKTDVLNITTLHKMSEDYMIPDEMEYFEDTKWVAVG